MICVRVGGVLVGYRVVDHPDVDVELVAVVVSCGACDTGRALGALRGVGGAIS